MSRINTNVQSLIAQRVLGQNNNGLNGALERLSTGLRINRGADDPAGLIASENLRAETTALNSAIGNAERADQVVNIAEGGLQEVSNLLSELQGLLTTSASSAGLSTSEREANQLQIDSILQTIDRISGQTSFQGTRLLNGNFDFQTTSVAGGVSDFRVNGALLDGGNRNVDVTVSQSAQQGGLYLSFGGAVNITGGTGSTFTLEVAGNLGSRELSFSSGTSTADIAAAINTFSDVTGVTASAVASTNQAGVLLRSSEYGSNEFVSVQAGGNTTIAGSGLYNLTAGDTDTINTGSVVSTFANLTNSVRDAGQDVAGTINGLQATGVGTRLQVNSDFLDVQIDLSTNSSDALNSVSLGGTTAFTITGGGAEFQLSGEVNLGGRVGLGIGDIATRKLGDSSDGFLNELGSGQQFNVVNADNLEDAQKIVSNSIEQVSSIRGRLGAFQRNVIGATTRSLGIAVENTAAANSVIRDADFASETASLTRNQILVSASQNTLALANNQPQSVLQLLG